MISTQQRGFSRYLSFKKLTVPSALRRFFYASWEDALWDIMVFLKINMGATALVPEFFCVDVIENMERHGLRCIEYPVDEKLQTDPTVFAGQLKKLQPSVVVVLQIDGMTNTLFKHAQVWKKELPAETLLIEDSVHSVVDPGRISLLTPRHIVVDSLRKVSPLWGSNLYGSAETFGEMRQTAWWRTIVYQLQLAFWWLSVHVSLTLAFVPIQFWKTWWGRVAEWVSYCGSEVIGDSMVSAPGWWVFSLLASHLAVGRVEYIKEKQVARYQTNLGSAWANITVRPVEFDREDTKRLRGFPVIAPLQHASLLLKRLRHAGLLVRFELDDCTWSQKRKLIFLPLGPHISLEEIDQICDLLRLHAQVR